MRAYPTPAQEHLLRRTFGCTRFVWNQLLAQRHARYSQGGEQTSYARASRDLTALKAQPGHEFLNDVSSVALQQSVRHQQAAFSAFFGKRARYPRFKARSGRQSATFVGNAFRFTDPNHVWLAKFTEPMRLAWSFEEHPGELLVRSVVVSQEADGRWYVAVVCEEDTAPLPATGESVGIDAGLTTFATLSTGETIEQPDFAARHARRLAHYQRMVARRQPGSSNRDKARRKLGRQSAKLRRQQQDFLHKASTQLVRRFDVVAVEDIDYSAMRRGWRRIGGKVGRLSHGAFRDMLAYKAERHGRRFVVIDRWYPSTKTCSACGYLLAELSLGTRRWTCPGCGARHDRDVNAAKNILAVGQTVTACGAGVRPAGATPGLSVTKQESARARSPG